MSRGCTGSIWRRTLPMVALVLLLTASTTTVRAEETLSIDQHEFELVWERTEAPVANGDTQRSWLWGPEPRTPGMTERYIDAPNEERTVQYFDKGRMEVNDPEADPADPWFVTSGLLTRELVSGKIQIGDDAFLDAGSGAHIHVAGDHQNPFPQYRHLASLIDQGNPDRTGERADHVLTPDGLDPDITAPDDPMSDFAQYIVYDGPEGDELGYNIPRAFWDYLNAPGTVYDADGNPTTEDPLFSWVYVMGYPIADAFWTEVPVSGLSQWVLIQPFERRVLTYTPNNPPEWQVEMGNIGQHYREWRSQYFPDAATGGDPAFFGLRDEASWQFITNQGVSETWESAGTIDSFIPGSRLYARYEYKLDFQRTTFWAPGENGLYLHGWDLRDEAGNLVDMVVYSPALHVLPADGQTVELVTDSAAISMQHPPQHESIEFSLVSRPLVSTPAGLFNTWRMESNDFPETRTGHLLGNTFWFEPEIGVVMWIDNDYSAHLESSSFLNE